MSIKDLLKNDNCIVVLDTNVLLNIYSYSPEFSDFALECLKKVRNYIYLPSTVRLEYENHYRFEFSKMEKRIARAGKATENQIRTAQRKILDSCDGLDFLHFPDVDVLRSNLAIKLDDLQNEFYNFFQERPTLDLIQYSWHDEDLLELFVKELDRVRCRRIFLLGVMKARKDTRMIFRLVLRMPKRKPASKNIVIL